MRVFVLTWMIALAGCVSASSDTTETTEQSNSQEPRGIGSSPPRGIASREPVFQPTELPEERCSGQGYHCVRIVYGTNRDRLPFDAGGQMGYGTEPEQLDTAYEVPEDLLQLPTTTRLETGEVIVTIPATHQPGDPIRRKRSDRDAVNEDERSDLFSFLRPPEPFYSYEGFSSVVTQLFEEADDKDALLHVHGFNVSFRNGAFRSAQLKSDTGFEGPVFYFSWPSNARVREYFNDQIDGDMSARALANFLIQVEEQLPDEGEIHVIAHSMGTRVFSQAVALLRDSDAWEGRDAEKSGPLFGAVILAAGDLDSGLAQEWLGPPGELAQSVTFLTSRNDRAVAFSGFLRNVFLRDPRRRKQRIGYFRPSDGPVVFPGVNVFDITFLKDRFWERFTSTNHSTYAADEFSINYISRLLGDPNVSPDVLVPSENGLRQCQAQRTATPITYWVIGTLTRRRNRVCSERYEAAPPGSRLEAGAFDARPSASND
ncbi:MAG: alpha/beta hydrolase [Pseudomonadota bacterium]